MASTKSSREEVGKVSLIVIAGIMSVVTAVLTTVLTRWTEPSADSPSLVVGVVVSQPAMIGVNSKFLLPLDSLPIDFQELVDLDNVDITQSLMDDEATLRQFLVDSMSDAFASPKSSLVEITIRNAGAGSANDLRVTFDTFSPIWDFQGEQGCALIDSEDSKDDGVSVSCDRISKGGVRRLGFSINVPARYGQDAQDYADAAFPVESATSVRELLFTAATRNCVEGSILLPFFQLPPTSRLGEAPAITSSDALADAVGSQEALWDAVGLDALRTVISALEIDAQNHDAIHMEDVAIEVEWAQFQAYADPNSDVTLSIGGFGLVDCPIN